MRRFAYRAVLGGALALASAAIAAEPAQKAALNLGPAAGSRVPSFEALDHNGKTRSLASLQGAKGTLLVFIRSADW